MECIWPGPILRRLNYLATQHLFFGVGPLLSLPGMIPVSCFQQLQRFTDDIADDAAQNGLIRGTATHLTRFGVKRESDFHMPV